MRRTIRFMAAIAAATLAACGDRNANAPDVASPADGIRLREITIPRLPAPFYHFDYDMSGRVTSASFASGLVTYDVKYDGDRIREMQAVGAGNQDRLQYAYDEAGRVAVVTIVDPQGLASLLLFFTYTSGALAHIEWDRRAPGGFLVDRTIDLSYHPDGNLFELSEHRRPLPNGQTESTTIDRYEAYDDGINVDGFTLLHPDFFEHLVLLPQVRLQRGNPARVTRSGSGINYRVDYTYTYDARHVPLVAAGTLVVLNGADEGRTFDTRSDYSYW